MRKLAILFFMGMLGACASMQEVLTPKSAQSLDIRACLQQEALTRIQDGSALASPVRTTVKKMVTACLAADADSETRQSMMQTAQEILTQLMQNKNN